MVITKVIPGKTLSVPRYVRRGEADEEDCKETPIGKDKSNDWERELKVEGNFRRDHTGVGFR